MKVKQLIEILSVMDPEREILVEVRENYIGLQGIKTVTDDGEQFTVIVAD